MIHPDRMEAIEWASDILDCKDYLICDTETTGLDHDAEICQIAFIDLGGKTQLDMLIKPVREISMEASSIHCIGNYDVMHSPSFAQAWPVIDHLMKSHPIIIYNAEFDTRMLWQSLRAHDLMGDSSAWRVSCAMLKYAAFCSIPGRFGGWRWQKLPGGDHSAIGDCRSVLKLLHEMADAEL